MKTVLCGLLLVLLAILQLGEGQQPTNLPSNGVQLYLPLEPAIIPDYSMIYASQFYADDQNTDGINDALWCQSDNTSSDIGVWYYPNGTQVPLFDGAISNLSAPRPLFSKRFSGQIALARRDGLAGVEGLYKCIIPDETGVNQTLVVGAYRDSTYDANNGPDTDSSMQFSLLSTRDTNPPVFTLSFNVSDGPPTNVTCTVVRSDPFTIASSDLSRVIVNGTGSVTQVTVTVRMREAGIYQCTVSNARVTNGTINGVTAVSNSTSLNVTVAGTPTNLTATRLNTGLAHVRLSWSPVSGVSGYEVFYQLVGSSTPVSVANTSTTAVNITSGLTLKSYTFSVVSYGSEGSTILPSDNSSTTVTFTLPKVTDLMTAAITSTTITLTWSPPADLVPTDYNIQRTCHSLCNESDTTTGFVSSVSSPHQSTGIAPYSQCMFSLTAFYGSDAVQGAVTSDSLSAAPTSSASNITFSSVEARSMDVSWNEVSCSGRNGPITGYLLTYSSTSFNDTVNITGGDNRQYILTALRPYTNYTVTVTAYNYGKEGPASDERTQETAQAEPGVISGLMSSGTGIQVINISWTLPTMPNGLITMYEIQYRESTSTGPYNMTTTTNTQYSIGGLLPNTNYTIGVRAVTSVGPGEWTNVILSTNDIPVIGGFSITQLNSTAFRAMWQSITGANHYTVYYSSTSSLKRQAQSGNRTFPSGTTQGVIGGLDPNLDYLFSISVTFQINGMLFEGTTTQLIPPGVTLTPSPIVMSSSTIMSSSSIMTLPSTTSERPASATVLMTPTPTTDIQSGGGGSAGAIAGGIIVALVIIAVVVVVTIVVILVLIRKRGQKSQYEVKTTNKAVAVSYTTTDAGYEEIKMESRRAPPPAPMPYKSSDTPPVIEEFPSTSTVEEGRQFVFKVSVKGQPQPTFNWYRDGELVTEDYAHEIMEDGSLMIVTVEERHKGTYRFVANNSAGTADQQVVLIVAVEGSKEAKLLNHDSGSANIGPIPVKEFGQFVANGHAKSNQGFKNQYSMLDSGESEHSVTVAVTPSNKPLNRFANITVYDDNRILLETISGRPDCQNDYINACFIDGYSSTHQYIATQGPLTKTLIDFWRLIWQEKSPAVVMVTNVKEEKKVKCQQYWPDSDSKDFGPFRVTLQEEQIFTDYTIRKLQLELLGQTASHPHLLTQYHFTSWPDHGVPEYATSILQYHRRIRNEYNPKRGPMTVHCSAGVGRTGTFIAIDIALQQAENEGCIDIISIINKMRQKRMKMVQTPDQYIFVNDAVLESVTCGNTQIDSRNARIVLNKMSKTDPSSGQTGYAEQFKVLEQVTQQPDEVRRDIGLQNAAKNRLNKFLPPDNHRVPLKGEHPDYINAVYINGYKQKKAFIIAESPMESTARNFWKMIADRSVTAVIMLCSLKEEGQEVCYQYWPSSHEQVVIGEFIVALEKEEKNDGYKERVLSVKHSETGEKHSVTQYQITNWDPSGHITNPQTVLLVMEEMYRVQRKRGNTTIVVHCSDTVSRSGMFCASVTTINKCKTEGMIDVFQVLKIQRIQKPGSVQTVQQYQGIFQIIMAYLDSFETYSNFNPQNLK